MSLFVRIVSGVEEASLGFIMIRTGFPSGLVVKNQPANAGDADSIPGSSSCLRKGTPLASRVAQGVSVVEVMESQLSYFKS